MSEPTGVWNPESASTERVNNEQADVAEPKRGQNLDTLLSGITSLDQVMQDWPEEYQLTVTAKMQAVDDLNAEAFRQLIKSLKSNPQLSAALREAATDEVVYAVLRRHSILKPSVFERVQSALDTIRPMLASHGGNVELVSVVVPLVEVRFLGACDGCPASALTFYSGVKQAILDNVPEITDIKQIKGLLSSADRNADSSPDDGVRVVQFTSPFANYKSDNWTLAISLSEITEGETVIKVIDKHSVILSRLGDKVTCFENACAHMGMPMDGGNIENGFLTCPYHGFEYSLDSGECLTAPEVQLQPHGVRVVNDRVEIQLTH